MAFYMNELTRMHRLLLSIGYCFTLVTASLWLTYTTEESLALEVGSPDPVRARNKGDCSYVAGVFDWPQNRCVHYLDWLLTIKEVAVAVAACVS